MTTVEPMEDVSAENAEEREVPAERSTRRRLSPEQQREVARLYADGATPTSEIRKRFGIGESSLYRILQRHAVPLRGRGPATREPGPSRAQTLRSGRRGSSAATGAQAPSVQPGSAATASGESRRGGRGSARRRVPSTDGRASAPGSGGRQQFRIQFLAERVVQAVDVRDALRQAESFGATEVTAVTRED